MFTPCEDRKEAPMFEGIKKRFAAAASTPAASTPATPPTPDLSLRIAADADPVAQLVNHVAILALEAQARFAETYADYNWRADLTEPPVFWFEREPKAIFRPHVIGTTSGQSDTWLWAWENVNNFPDSVVEVANAVKAIGEQLGARDLTTAEQPLDADARQTEGLGSGPGLWEVPAQTLTFAAASVGGLRVPVFYRAPTGGGSFVWFLLDNEAEFTLPQPTALATATAIGEALSSGHLTDHKAGLRAYAQRRAGVRLDEGADTWTLHTADGAVAIAFDDQDRIVRITTGN